MSLAVATPRDVERLERIWSDEPGIVGFLKTVDHKRIGKRYLATSVVFLLLGGVQALMMRTQLASPDNDLLSPELYNQLMTMHGTTMIFLFNTPIWAGFGNYFLPLQIGTRDMAFPRLNALSYWIFLLSGIFIYSSFFVGEIPDGGWFAYVPLTGDEFSPSVAIDFWAIGLAFLGVSTTVGAINFLVTTFKMRAPGMSVSRIPIFVWGIVVMSFMIVFALPSVTLAQLMLAIDRIFEFTIFVPAAGGDPLLFQHLFWIWGHPEVYIVFVPATAVVSMVITVHARARLVGHLLVVTALIAIGFISFGVWAHHMFATGLGYLALSFFAAASFIVSIPSGVQFFAWIGTLWEGRPRFEAPMLWALGMMFIFLLGGITGVMVAMVPFDFQAQDSYFVVAHFHYTLVGGSVFPIFAALYHWWPKITGRLPSPAAGKTAFWLAFIGFNVTFFPQHILGLWGMTRRIYTYESGIGWDGLNLLSTVGAYVLATGFLLAVVTLVWSRYRGAPTGPDPWAADSLEWATASPTPDYDFEQMPVVDSLYPLWDAGEGGVRGGDVLLPPEGEEEHYTLSTGGVDAVDEAVMPMPSPTYSPLIVAVGMLIGAYGALVRSPWLGLFGVGVIALALATWFWPDWDDEPIELEHADPEEVRT